jgi:hypothetical protein
MGAPGALERRGVGEDAVDEGDPRFEFCASCNKASDCRSAGSSAQFQVISSVALLRLRCGGKEEEEAGTGQLGNSCLLSLLSL